MVVHYELKKINMSSVSIRILFLDTRGFKYKVADTFIRAAR